MCTYLLKHWYKYKFSETHHSCERREHAFMVLREYTIISPEGKLEDNSNNNMEVESNLEGDLEKN